MKEWNSQPIQFSIREQSVESLHNRGKEQKASIDKSNARWRKGILEEGEREREQKIGQRATGISSLSLSE